VHGKNALKEPLQRVTTICFSTRPYGEARGRDTTGVVVFDSGTVLAPPRKQNLGTREAVIFVSIAVLESPRTRTGRGNRRFYDYHWQQTPV